MSLSLYERVQDNEVMSTKSVARSSLHSSPASFVNQSIVGVISIAVFPI